MALSSWERRFAIASVSLALSGAAVARALTPDGTGLRAGTMELAPSCSLRAMTGLPCPSCGMTRAWVWSAHGELLEASRYNFGGVLLFGFVLLNGLVGVWTLWRGRPATWAWPATKAWGVLFAFVWLGGWFLRLLDLYPLPGLNPTGP